MIEVRCLGHIRTSLGGERIVLDEEELTAAQLVEKLRSMSSEKNPGFNTSNTLALIGDGEAFLPAGSSRKVRSGDRVVLIPFSHGG